MINIVISENEIEAKGHASTLICNSISVLMWSLAICLDNAGAEDFEVEEADGFQKVSYSPTEKTKPIFQGFVKSIELMGIQYPNHISVTAKKKV